jgi:Ca2+-binding EF-hand superfamily protein
MDVQGMSADEVLEEIGAQQESWLYTWLVDSTGLRQLFLAMERADVLRTKKDFRHPYPGVFKVCESARFESIVGGVIAFNAIMIGVQSSQTVASPADGFEILEHFFLVFFLFEVMLRCMAYGWTWIFKWQNLTDFIFLVFIPVLNSWVLIPSGVQSSFLRNLQILRIFRMVRLVRMVKTWPAFREMWVMLRGLIECGRTLFWTYVMILCLLFLFSIVAVDFIADHPAFIHDDATQDLFGTLPDAMFTLMQVMTLDSWTFIARPMMMKLRWVSLYFVALILLVVMVLLNLITAVIVENAFSIVQEDEDAALREKEKMKELEIEKFRVMFKEMDTDGGGTLSFQEFEDSMDLPAVQTAFKALEIEQSELSELWELLDDGDDAVTIDEFCEGLRKIQSEVKAKEIMECIRKMRQLHNRTSKQRKRCKLALEAAEHMLECVDNARQKMSDTVLICQDTMHCVHACRHWQALVPHLQMADEKLEEVKRQ